MRYSCMEFVITLDPPTEVWLRRLAEAQQTSPEQLVARLLRYQAAEAGLEPLRAELAQLAQAAGWTTEADVFAEVS